MAAGGDRRTLDCGDHRCGIDWTVSTHLRADLEDLPLLLERSSDHLGQIVAAEKHGTGRRQHHDTDGLVIAEALQRGGDRTHHAGGQRVPLARPVEVQTRDARPAVEARPDRIIHAAPLPASTRSPMLRRRDSPCRPCSCRLAGHTPGRSRGWQDRGREYRESDPLRDRRALGAVTVRAYRVELDVSDAPRRDRGGLPLTTTTVEFDATNPGDVAGLPRARSAFGDRQRPVHRRRVRRPRIPLHGLRRSNTVVVRCSGLFSRSVKGCTASGIRSTERRICTHSTSRPTRDGCSRASSNRT